MSANPQSLSEVRALAEQSLGDPESSQHFLLALGVTPEAFTGLDEQAQAKHLQQLQAGERNLQGNVQKHSDQALQAQLLGRNQVAIAERVFEAYNFGEGVAVAGASGWEYYAAGHERSRAVYFENAIDDGKGNSTTQLGFTVRFDPQTGALAEAYASDYKGQIWGSLPQGKVENFEVPNSIEHSAPSPKHYRAAVRGGGDLDISPQVAIFHVDEQLAREIIRLSKLVKENDLYKLERSDYRANFLQHDPESSPDDAKEAADENVVRAEWACLVVKDDSFCYQANVQHTNVVVKCEYQSISELANHFGLQFDSLNENSDLTIGR